MSIRDELQGQCSLPMAENKNTVVATKAVLAERVAARLGPWAEVGALCKKLEADYALVAPTEEAVVEPWPQARRRAGG